MRVVIGYHLDSAAYPHALRDMPAVVGTVVTGFRGLVGILETQLGLVSPAVSETRRIAEWEDRIRQLEEHKRQTDGEDLPFSKSFKVDPWNTAKELLRRRDELVLAGWDPTVHEGGGRYIEVLAMLEMQSEERKPGFVDRVRDLLRRLGQPALLELTELEVVDEDETLWEPWCRKLIQALKNRGVKVQARPRLSSSPLEGSDLSLLQRVRQKETPPHKASGDGSVLLVRAENEWDVADYLASWLESHGSKDTVVIHQHGSILLDEILHQRGLPALGTANPSPWRSMLQVLPLTIETYWDPLRVEPLLQVLTIPRSPVPYKIRYRLARALANAPGVGGPSWNSAIDEGYQSLEGAWQEESLDVNEIRRKRAAIEDRLNVWVHHDTYNPDDGIPLGVLVHVCQMTEHWAAGQLAVTGDGLYAVAAEHASQVAEAARALGVSRVSRLHVARILNSVLADGVHFPELGQEASEWHVVNHPGQIYEPAETILWCGFYATGHGSNAIRWTSAERAWLQNCGVVLPDESLARKREAAAWNRAVNMAEGQLILFAPAKVRGEDVLIHPLWDEIRYAVAQELEVEKQIVFDASVLRRIPFLQLRGKTIERIELRQKEFPGPTRDWRVPQNTIGLRPIESAKSLEKLLGCPLSWTLQYPARIRYGQALSLPSVPQILGTLAHEVLRGLLVESKRWEPDAATVKAGILFDSLSRTLAAPILEPHNGVLRQESKRRIQTAMRRFFAIMNRAGIEIEETEHELRRNWKEGVDIEGRLDLKAKTASGLPIVIDAKWSFRPQQYRERLEKFSTQLTLYRWLLAEDSTTDLPAAYYMLRDGELFAHPLSEVPSEYHVVGPSLDESVELLKGGLETAWKQLEDGMVVAAGIPDTSSPEADPLVEPPCRYCDYKNLCGREGVRV